MTLAPGAGLGTVPAPVLRTVALAAGAAFAALTVPMQVWERRMRATGGPGIVGLQLADDPRAAEAVLATWGRAGRAAARQQTWADFAYLKTYAYAGVCAGELVRRRTPPASGWDRSGQVVRWLPAVAAACDAVENVALLRTLAVAERGDAPDTGTVRVTRGAARLKFGLLVASIGWAVGAAAAGARSSRSR